MNTIERSKTCENCKARKVRCSKLQPSDAACTNCMRRREECRFGHSKRLRKFIRGSHTDSADKTSLSHHEDSSFRQEIENTHLIPVAGDYRTRNDVLTGQRPPPDIEYLLQHRRLPGRHRDDNTLYKALDSYVSSSNLAVFSESKLQSISEILGHNKLYDLIENMRTHINTRRAANKTSCIEARFKVGRVHLSVEVASSYIESYFAQVHPMYPFLNRKIFEEKASSPHMSLLLETNVAWSALYHGVLALGSQFHDKGDFFPEKGLSWQLFRQALGTMPHLVGPDAGLLHVQAVIIIAIFSQNLSSYTLENFLVSKAARIAMHLNFNKETGKNDSDETAAAFWVIYCLEKSLSFNDALSSLIVDFDISCSIPKNSESVIEGQDWFLSAVTLARIQSIAYETLFSVKATANSVEQLCIGIKQVHAGLEHWKMSLPEFFRPGGIGELHSVSSNLGRILVYQHFTYHSVVMSISRLSVRVGEPRLLSDEGIGKSSLIQAARLVLELARFTVPKVYSSIWIVGGMPLAAMFVLFESIIYDPVNTEAKNNLFFLDMAAGLFSRLEYDSCGSILGSLFSEFTFLAREFLHSVESESILINGDIERAEGASSSNTRPNMDDTSSDLTVANLLCEDNESILIECMDIFDPMLLNEDWAWYSQPHV